MMAQTFVYGKGRSFQYGIEIISPHLRPVQQELVELSAYRGCTEQDRSLRYGFLQNGDSFLSFAFSLPHGNQNDSRSQIKVFTLVFSLHDDCPLSRDLLRVLPSLTLQDLEGLVTSTTVDTRELLTLGQDAPPLPQASPELILALLSVLFYQAERRNTPALLALASPQELLAAIAALPSWLWPHLTFNTDLRQITEPLELVNAWTPAAKQAAERSNYSGAAADRPRFDYPAEEGVLLHIGSLEQEARTFLQLSRETQWALFLSCGQDLSTLVSRLRSQHKPADNPSAPPPKRTRKAKRKQRRHPPSELSYALLLLAAGLLLLPMVACWVPPTHCYFKVLFHTDTFLFLGSVVLGWLLCYGIQRLTRGPTNRFLFNIHQRGNPNVCSKLYHLCQVSFGVFLLCILGLLYLVGVGQVSAAVSTNTLFLTLHLGGTPLDLVRGNLVGGLLWSLQALYALGSVCRSRLHHR